MSFKSAVSEINGIHVIELRGEVDAEAVKDIRILIANKKKIIFDVSQTDYIDSDGFGLIIGVHRNEVNMAVVCARNKRVRQMFNLLGLQNTFGIHDTMEEAVLEITAS